MATFELDRRIADATLPVVETELCLIRLMNDRRYPWVLLIPRRADISELFHLAPADRQALIETASEVARRTAQAFTAQKMNVGSLRNRVSQFHLHVVVRHTSDATWPDGIWNGAAASPYGDGEREEALGLVGSCLAGLP